MLRKLLLTFLCMVFSATFAFAQNGAVEGTVLDNNNETIPGANVLLVETEQGTATGVDGNFSLDNVEPGTYTLRVTFVGFMEYNEEITVESGETVTVNAQLEADTFGLDEVVVTGVSSGTETKKLGFSVSKLGDTQLSKVPASNVGSALQGKISGVTITSASGDPASAPSIRMRGSTSLSGEQDPLIIIDGVITDGSLADINMQDVESIEVVKGAAAASLYGSLAGNGVVQIITKSNSEEAGKTSVNFRTEYGISEIAKDYPVATTHGWVTDDVELTEDGNYVESWSGYETYDSDRVFDNEYPVQYDNVDAIFTGQPYSSNYLRVSNTKEDFNYSASYENLDQAGVVKGLPNYTRNSVRINGNYEATDNFELQFNGSYVNSQYPYFTEQGQGSNYFYSALTAPPFVNLLERNEATGEYSNQPTGYGIAGSNFENPLYVAENRERNRDRDRYIAGLRLTYDFTDWLSVNARQSLDSRSQVNRQHTPVGYQTPSPSATFNNGYESIQNINESTNITEIWAEFDQDLNADLSLSGTLKYLYEDRDYNQAFTSGYDYSVSGIRDINATDSDNLSASSTIEEERVENYIGDLEFDYQDKIILGAMLRRDGSSLFGEDERYRYYYRGSLAYRLTEDIDINNIDELKLRASYGTSGQRPPFAAQYETYTPAGDALIPQTLGNSEIQPSIVAETEFGVDVNFLERFSFTANYSLTNVTDDYLEVPLSGSSAFATQWQNVGEIENTSLEFELGGQLIAQQDFSWNVDLQYSKNTQTVTDLGGAPAFTRGTDVDAAIDLFRFEEGVEYGAMHGNQIVTSIDDLTVNDNGEVLNIGGNYTTEDFTVNSLGHVVLAEDQGTPDERPLLEVDENGDAVITNIGNTNPDFNMGLSTDFNYKGLGLYMVWDLSYGGEVYNYSRQLMYNRYMHADLETYSRQGVDPSYAVNGLYNTSNPTSHFVEDGTYLKLREAAVSYTLGGSTLGAVGNYVSNIELSVVGRNLLTFTDYSGFDPEVGLRSNSTNFRIDEYAYPNFRTYSGSIQINF